jgi:hypothetical protein
MQVDRRFRSLVERLTREAAERPDAYRRRVILAATLGYLFITLVFMMLLAVIASAIAGLVYARAGAALELKIAFVCALIAYALLRSMFIPHSKPDGIEVFRDRVPALFDMVEGVRRDVNGPAIHAVYITDEMNASLGQPPRFWMFGTRNILSLGLPLMQTLNQDELKSVIAHELGHSLGGHGRWASFVYRVRVRWLQLAERLPTGMVAGLLRRFFKWYGPWFNAYSFVLARTQNLRPTVLRQGPSRLRSREARSSGSNWRRCASAIIGAKSGPRLVLRLSRAGCPMRRCSKGQILASR